MSMHNPPHPGELLREDVLPALHVSIEQLALHLQTSYEVLSQVVNGSSPISKDLAARLEGAGIGKARHWLAMQSAHERWLAENPQQPHLFSR
ncbi:TPA: HigA family addiction module antidote protein [Pseudomonas aeruginosa]|uniref:HigA family addiction module antitoxin n=2 Tax=Pseudomonas aeruginosa TaxID=287 RepID=UPI000BB93A49|nr:HigA family addiction module antitoxin [Pseudomonas aeruginosa]MDJ1398750.1 HigA family addiction module antitoxin [Pseudomonas aeruginosa]MDU0689592.1 HigA family addiction module antitoxin [Pseudomonas aeruginosa]PBX15435.1 addiction module antidote protein, HigA family [Pseudomonas aeruginosa]HBP5599368.1 addiction module antidote protein, HigA family [Pseudomonas aeruginosa]HCF1603722.1 HigA family addiction module antidote protein [Pseudomonas aeruginosa]